MKWTFFFYSLLTDDSLSTSDFVSISQCFKKFIELKYNSNVKYEIGQFVVRLLYHHSYFLPKMTDKITAVFFLYDLFDPITWIENPFCGIIYDIIVSVLFFAFMFFQAK